MRNIILLFLTLFVVTGCAAVPGYDIARDERNVGAVFDDTGITSSIKTSLMRKDAEQGYATKVYSFNGHVYLVGAVKNNFRQMAIDTASGVSGVKDVTAVWFSEAAKTDTALDFQLRTALIGNGALSSSQISFEAYDGNVVLLGLVRSGDDVTEAVKTARAVSGVKSVRSYLKPSR